MLRVAYAAALLAVVQGRTSTTTETPFVYCSDDSSCESGQICSMLEYRCREPCTEDLTCSDRLGDSNALCLSDGSCGYEYCDEGDSSSCSNSTDVCGENDVCTSPCSNDDECYTVYDGSCDVNTGLCVYRPCDSDAFCQNSTINLAADEYQICDMSDYFSWSCTESCASPTAYACDYYGDTGAYCNETSGVCQKDYCSDDSECGDDKVCQYSSYCVDSCLSQNATYCAIQNGDRDSRCADDGQCGSESCDETTACSVSTDICSIGSTCTAPCSSDDECTSYNNMCAEEQCVYRQCDTADNCTSPLVCDMSYFPSWYCTESCVTDGCSNTGAYCNDTSGICQTDKCDDDSECGDDRICQNSEYCVDSCVSQNATFCAMSSDNRDSRCQDDGGCDTEYCYEYSDFYCSTDGDVCTSSNVCSSPCSSTDECTYGYECDSDSAECVYRQCYSDDNCTANYGDDYICSQSDFSSWYCKESCLSQGCEDYLSDAYYCSNSTGECLYDQCDDSSNCTTRDGYDTCQLGSCVMGCGNFNATYCSYYGGSDAVCQSDGTCEANYCYDDDDVCPDGTACNGDTCVLACAEDSECADRYGDSSYVCDVADSGACVYRACSADDECGDGYYCDTEETSWYCNEGCATNGCDLGDYYDCTDACQSDGRCECTFLGCLAEDNPCEYEGLKTECQDDGECGYPEDCAVDDDCEDSQVCQYGPDFDAGPEAYEKRFCADSCVGQEEVYDDLSYCQAYFSYENCDADTGTCYTCRSSDDCTDDSIPTCYAGTNGNGCYLGCDTDDDCAGDHVCQYAPQGGLYYCGEEGDQTPQPTMDTTMSSTMDTMEPTTMEPSSEPSTDPTMEPTVMIVDSSDEIIDNNSGAVRHGVVMVAMTGLMWWM